MKIGQAKVSLFISTVEIIFANNDCLIFVFTYPPETRYRAKNRLAANLQSEDATDEADNTGFVFPTDDPFDAALRELMKEAEAEAETGEEEGEVVEEEMVLEWDEVLGEEWV